MRTASIILVAAILALIAVAFIPGDDGAPLEVTPAPVVLTATATEKPAQPAQPEPTATSYWHRATPTSPVQVEIEPYPGPATVEAYP